MIFLVTALATFSCVKETYDMNKLSKRAHLSPTLAVSAFRGDISLSDLIDPNDTVVFDENNFVKIVFKKDTVIEFLMEDYYDLNDMVSFSQSYPIGDLNLAPFLGTVSYTLNQISVLFDPGLRAQFVALDGTTSEFPPFPITDMGEITYSLFPNFEYALFKEGSIDIIVDNNLTAPLSGVSIRLYNTSDHSQIGNEAIISSINPGTSGIATINIADATIRNSITAAISINGSPGTPGTPVLIDLNGSNVEITIAGRDMKVRSGRVVIPTQTITSLDNNDTVEFDPGTDIEIDIIKMNLGNISYAVQSGTPLTSEVSLTLPTALRSGVPVTESLTVAPAGTLNGTISIDNTTIDLGTVTAQPYNMLPVDYLIEVSSNGDMITFSNTDEINLDIELLNPDFDYVKGYFGQQTETMDPDTFDLDIKEILDHISGSFLISSPVIKLNYSNSFAVPIEIDLNAAGKKMAETVDLDLNPFTLSYPAAPAERDIDDVFTIDKNNSALPELISMPPEKIPFSGSSVMNPLGNDGSRDNYIFGDSRFVGSLEVEVPMELRINNLQFTDTVDNFMQNDDPDADSPVNPEDFEFLRIDIDAENGFPLGVSLSMTLYDSATHVNKCTIDAADVLEPAPVDINGKVTEPMHCSTSIEITREFWNSINVADKIIFRFTLVSTDDGSKDVKIYSDYSIDFKAAIVLKPDIKLDL